MASVKSAIKNLNDNSKDEINLWAFGKLSF